MANTVFSQSFFDKELNRIKSLVSYDRTHTVLSQTSFNVKPKKLGAKTGISFITTDKSIKVETYVFLNWPDVEKTLEKWKQYSRRNERLKCGRNGSILFIIVNESNNENNDWIVAHIISALAGMNNTSTKSV